MMSFLVTAAGHSGTKFLATQLGKAPGWTVEHEPSGHILPVTVNRRFRDRRYGEVNSWLISSIRHIQVHRKAIIMRNPYEILKSVVRDGQFAGFPDAAVTYVRESVATLDGLARDGYPIIRFGEMIRSTAYILSVAKLLGIDQLECRMVDTNPVNQHVGKDITVTLSDLVMEEFDYYNRQWSCA